MAVIETSIVIQATPEAIYDFTSQTNRIPEWFEGVEALKPDAAYPEVGSKLKVTYKAAGVTLETTGTVVTNDYGQKYAVTYEGMATGTQTWTYTPQGGGTKVTLHFDYEMAGGGLGKVVDKLLVERQNTRNFEQSLKNLKARMEG